MIQAIYKANRRIEPAHGTITIFVSNNNFWEVELWQSADMQTAHCSYRINATSLDMAIALYNDKVKPEIAKKERLYLSRGIFDNQNN